MSECGCEGSCPLCKTGEVDNHVCNKCRTRFCDSCHGALVAFSSVMEACSCGKDQGRCPCNMRIGADVRDGVCQDCQCEVCSECNLHIAGGNGMTHRFDACACDRGVAMNFVLNVLRYTSELPKGPAEARGLRWMGQRRYLIGKDKSFPVIAAFHAAGGFKGEEAIARSITDFPLTAQALRIALDALKEINKHPATECTKYDCPRCVAEVAAETIDELIKQSVRPTSDNRG